MSDSTKQASPGLGYGLGLGLVWLLAMWIYVGFVVHMTDARQNAVFLTFLGGVAAIAVISMIVSRQVATALLAGGAIGLVGFLVLYSATQNPKAAWKKKFDEHLKDYVAKASGATVDVSARLHQSERFQFHGDQDLSQYFQSLTKEMGASLRPKVIVIKVHDNRPPELVDYAYRALPTDLIALTPDEVQSVCLLRMRTAESGAIQDALTLVDLKDNRVIVEDMLYSITTQMTFYSQGGQTTSVSSDATWNGWIDFLTSLPRK